MSNPISASNTATVSIPVARPAWRPLALLPGLALTGVLAFIAIQLARVEWLQSRGIGALTLAIVLGMLVGNAMQPKALLPAAAGVAFCKTRLLRWGIVLYGLRLTFRDIGHVGWTGVAIDATVLCSTFAMAFFLGVRVFGLDRETAMLIGAGSSICGAAAVMASEPVVRGRADQVTVAVATVVVFGTVAIFLYPALYEFSQAHHWLAMSQTAYGMYVGSTVHEVAQVVAAGSAVGEHAANTAVIAKMVRVMMLAPFLMLLSMWLSRSPASMADADSAVADSRRAVTIPWFALGFVAVAGVNSLKMLPPSWTARATDIDNVLLAMAMAGLGLTTHVSAIRRAGVRPLALAALLFAWLIGGGLAINAGYAAMFGAL